MNFQNSSKTCIDLCHELHNYYLVDFLGKLPNMTLEVTASSVALGNTMSAVDISWNSVNDTERYVVVVNGESFITNESYITVVLTCNMTFPGTISVINSCGQNLHQNFTVQVRQCDPEPQMEDGKYNIIV